MTPILLATTLGLVLTGAPLNGAEAPRLAAFILEGVADEVRAVDPDGRVRQVIEKEIAAEFKTPHARMMTRPEMAAAARRNPEEFARGASALEGARALRAPLVFGLTMKNGLSGARVVLWFGRSEDGIPLVRLEVVGTSQRALLESWDRKKREFIDAAIRSAEEASR